MAQLMLTLPYTFVSLPVTLSFFLVSSFFNLFESGFIYLFLNVNFGTLYLNIGNYWYLKLSRSFKNFLTWSNDDSVSGNTEIQEYIF